LASAVNRVGALHVVEEHTSYFQGSRDDPLWLYGLRDDEVEVHTCASLSKDAPESEWLLLDSGSMVHACRSSDGPDVPADRSKGAVLQAVNGDSVPQHGVKTMQLELGDEGIPTQLDFQVADVAYPLLSLGKILSSGAKLTMSGTHGFIEHKGLKCSVQVRKNVMMVKARRRDSPHVSLVAPLAAQDAFDRMMQPFDPADEGELDGAERAVEPQILPGQDLANDEEREQAMVAEAPVNRVEAPAQPTQEEYERHQLTHLPYAPWCLHCQRVKSRENKHQRRDEDAERAHNVLHFDYCFFADVVDVYEDTVDLTQKPHAVLVGYDSDSGSMIGVQVKCKGKGDTYAVGAVRNWIRALGITSGVFTGRR